jgi:hypothetical protein
MHSSLYSILAMLLIWALAPCAAEPASTQTSTLATPLYDSFKTFSYELGPDSEPARSSFHRGLTLSYAFNHQEAVRWFERAAKQAKEKNDSKECLICLWGEAYALGPNINLPLTSTGKTAACAPLNEAKEKLKVQKHPTDLDRRLIAALNARYQCDEPNKGVNRDAYAMAMKHVYYDGDYQSNDDVATLYADALLNINPWRWWKNGKATSGYITEAVGVLETVLDRNPSHLGANHMYIHAMEGSPHPEKALASADFLAENASGLGHLRHTPSHIHVHTKDYEKAQLVNQKAIDDDRIYLGVTKNRAYGPYCNHNLQFLAYSASLERSNCKAALGPARDLRCSLMRGKNCAGAEEDCPMPYDKDLAIEYKRITLPVQQWRAATPWFTLAGCRKWPELRADLDNHDVDEEKQTYLLAMKYFFSGLVYVWREEAGELHLEMVKLEGMMDELEGLDVEQRKKNEHPVYEIQAAKQGQIALALLRAEEARLNKDSEKLRNYRAAALKAERELEYKEPPAWLFPAREISPTTIEGE